MNLHEYQAKGLFSKYGIPVPAGLPAASAAEARQCAEKLGGTRWVVKAQAHTGGRGKAGGVAIVDTLEAVEIEAARMFGTRLVTKQTGAGGLPVSMILVEQPSAIDKELYLSLLVDRAERKILIMASQAGGMNIEEVAEATPEKIILTHIDPAADLQPYQIRRIGFALGLSGAQIKQFGSC